MDTVMAPHALGAEPTNEVSQAGTTRAAILLYLGTLGLDAATGDRVANRLREHLQLDGGPEAALRELEAHLAAWFGQALGEQFASPEEAIAIGQAAFLSLADAASWHDALAEALAPHELASALRRAAPRPVPEAEFYAMHEQPLQPPRLGRILTRLLAVRKPPQQQTP